MVAPTLDARVARASASPGLSFSPGDFYLRGLMVLLVGYALAGRGFAGLGVGPIYVGELALAAGVATVLVTRAYARIPRTGTVLALLALMAWCAMLTVAGLRTHGADALRDGVIWGYGVFALVVAGLLNASPGRLAWWVSRYERFGRLFLVTIPGIWLLRTWWVDHLPLLPGTDIPIVYPKPSDILVHLGGFAAYLLAGASGLGVRWTLAVLPGFALTAVRTRGGMLAFFVALGAVAACRPRSRRVWTAAVVCLTVGLVLLQVDTGRSVAGRTLSGRQLRENVVSILGGSRSQELEGPRVWRLDWWRTIVDYTVFGPHFWTGKGFGVNLAIDDGFSLPSDEGLRSPHNSHLTFLARAGIPGLLLWCTVQAVWLREMLRRYRESRSRGLHHWSRLFAFLVAYWLAFLTNAAFDVSLEGPMMGIWFWTVFGVGLACSRIQQRCPEVLEPCR